ncbi:MAG TPA: hypothetical protein VJ547_05250 [Candidatus Thermoplasmatota archaeon]|nr:hypothetical protein [Candidatus Thermoplasmatota archaeon]
MSTGTDQIRIGKLRISRRKFKRRVYQVISILIVFWFLAALVYTILFGQAPQ